MTKDVGTPAQDTSIPSGIKVHYSTDLEETPKVEEPKPEPQSELEEPIEDDSHDVEPDSEESEGKPHKKSGYKKTKEQRDQLRAENDALKAEIEGYKKPKVQETKTFDDGKPDPDKFDKTLEYMEALADYKVSQRFSQINEEQSQAKLLETARARAEKFKEVTPDYEEVVGEYINSRQPLSEAMVEQFQESELGPQLAYHIANTEGLGAHLAQLNRVQLAKEIGKLEMKLETPAVKKETKAPAPINPVKNGSTNSGMDYSKAPTLSELRKHWKPIR